VLWTTGLKRLSLDNERRCSSPGGAALGLNSSRTSGLSVSSTGLPDIDCLACSARWENSGCYCRVTSQAKYFAPFLQRINHLLMDFDASCWHDSRRAAKSTFAVRTCFPCFARPADSCRFAPLPGGWSPAAHLCRSRTLSPASCRVGRRSRGGIPPALPSLQY